MTVETPIENPPPLINAVKIPEYARAYCDTWGNIKKPPVKKIEQSNGRNFIKIYIFQAEPGFFWGFQLKLNKLILQSEANIKDDPYKTENEAIKAARLTIEAVVSEHSKKMANLLLSFDKICYNQPELF